MVDALKNWHAGWKAERILRRIYELAHAGEHDDRIFEILREEGMTDVHLAQALRVIATEFNWKRL